MKTIDLFYSVCQYIPDEIRAEKINVGIVVHCPTKDYEYSEFIHIKNKKRLYYFDDDLDNDYINLMFEHLKYQFNYSHLKEDNGVDEFENINSEFFLEQKIKYYVNEFSFLPIQKITIKTSEMMNAIEDLTRTYLYYDVPKEKRITRPEVKKLLSKEICNLNLRKFIKNENMIYDFQNEPIFDFQYDNTFVRTFSFDYANKSSLTKEIKIFLYDLMNSKDNLSKKNIVIVLNNNIDKKTGETEAYKKYIETQYSSVSNIYFLSLNQYATFLLKNGLKDIVSEDIISV